MRRRQQRRGAVRAIGVQPNPVLAAEAPDRVEIVVQAGARRAGRGDERHRAATAGMRTGECRVEILGDDALEAVGVKRDESVLAEAEDADGACDRVVRRWRSQHAQVGRRSLHPRVGRDAGAGAEQRRQVRERATVGEDAGTRGRVPADLGEHPVEHGDLDRGRGGAHLPHRHRVVDGAVHEVRERSADVRGCDLVGEIAGVMDPERAGEVGVEEVAEGICIHAAVPESSGERRDRPARLPLRATLSPRPHRAGSQPRTPPPSRPRPWRRVRTRAHSTWRAYSRKVRCSSGRLSVFRHREAATPLLRPRRRRVPRGKAAPRSRS